MSTERFRLVLVSAGTSDPSSTRLLADRTADRVKALAARRGHEVTVGVIELREIAADISTALVSQLVTPRLQQAITALAEADGIVAAAPVYGHGPSMEDFMDLTPLSVGSPQQVIDKTLTFREHFGDYQRQLFLMDHAGLPLKTVLDQLDLLGEEVVPVLRKEIAARQDPQTPDAPTHASLVKAKYGDEAPRQPRPNANRGDNVTGASPYQDSADEFQAEYPEL